jgi:hypothetical protein
MHKGYKCLEVSTGCIYISRDVVFNEVVFPFTELHANVGVRLRVEINLLPSTLLPSSNFENRGHQFLVASLLPNDHPVDTNANTPGDICTDVQDSNASKAQMVLVHSASSSHQSTSSPRPTVAQRDKVYEQKPTPSIVYQSRHKRREHTTAQSDAASEPPEATEDENPTPPTPGISGSSESMLSPVLYTDQCPRKRLQDGIVPRIRILLSY